MATEGWPKASRAFAVDAQARPDDRSAVMDAPRYRQTTPVGAGQSDHYNHGRELDLRALSRRRQATSPRCQVEAPDVFTDLSKNLVDATGHAENSRRPGAQCRLLDTATPCSPARPSMHTETGRAVTAPRCAARAHTGPFSDEGSTVVLDTMLDPLRRGVRDTAASGIRHVVNIGIGGSDLGPQMAVPLQAFDDSCPACSFASSPTSTAPTSRRCCRSCKPAETTLFLSQQDLHHQETMANATPPKFINSWRDRHRRHFVATTTSDEGGCRVRHHHHLRLLGLGGRALLAVVRRSACRWPSPSAPRISFASRWRPRDGPPFP